MEKVKVGFYRIDQCGYYSRPRGSEHKFCQIEDLLRQLHGWADKKSLVQTKIYDKDNIMPAYVYSVHRHQQGDYLVMLWNEVASADEGVPSVAANGVVGNAQVHLNTIEPGTIPGFPSYFWFPATNQSVFANIRLQFLTGGHAQLKAYLQAFLERSSDHVVYSDKPKTADAEIIGYRQQDSDTPDDFLPKFRSLAFRQSGLHDYILKNVLNIHRVKHRALLNPSVGNDRQWWQKIWQWMSPEINPPTPTNPIRFEYELKTSMTPDEVQSIINHASEIDEDSWSDVGFDIRGNNSTFWLNKSYARGEFDLNLNRSGHVVVDGISLLDELVTQKARLLSLIQDE